jgi:hypothetical protein
MATVSVATWEALTTAVNSATEDTTVELTSDIDMNEELPTGVTTIVRNPSYKVIINGNGHKIKNLYCTIPSSSGSVLGGASSSNLMEINDVDFENAYLTNSARLGASVEWHNCSLSIKLENSRIGDCTYYYCGLAVTGFGKSYLGYSGNATFYFCNIEVNGEFADISGKYYDTYVKGDCTAGQSAIYGRLAIINATIAFTGDVGSYGTRLILYNSETITVPSGKTISANLIPCTTAELMSPSALRAKSFPLW